MACAHTCVAGVDALETELNLCGATGVDFSVCKIVQTCLDMAGGASKCAARQAANRNVGPSYPQGVSVVAPAPASMQGLYVVATNNKEDVVITRVPWTALLDELE